jgi:glycine/D-amino acid oxidase-like deaminating enzyme
MDKQRFLIVGAGVAGICLAKHLSDKGHSIFLIDNAKNRSSVVAAGMINPIVFRRTTKSWRVDELLPYAEQFYTAFGKECNSNFYHPISIRRVFSSEQERNFWLQKQSLPEFSDYLTLVSEEDDHFSGCLNPFGSGRVKGSAYVSPVDFVEQTKKWFDQRNGLIVEEFVYNNLDPVKLTYNGNQYDRVIFCEGVEVIHNPWFNDLQVNHTKGETLTIRSHEIPQVESLNRKCFVLPLRDQIFRVGATYTWNTYESMITDEARKELREKLAILTDASYDVIDQNAGVRPTTMDRRPLIGQHEVFSGLYVMNGLGTKGYMIAPLIAKELCDHLLYGKPLNPEVDLKRLKK